MQGRSTLRAVGAVLVTCALLPAAAQAWVTDDVNNITLQQGFDTLAGSYYAVTDDDGAFAIKNAPAGAFRHVYWHENGWKGKAAGRLGDPVTLAPGPGGTTELKPTDFDVPVHVTSTAPVTT